MIHTKCTDKRQKTQNVHMECSDSKLLTVACIRGNQLFPLCNVARPTLDALQCNSDFGLLHHYTF